MTNTVLSVVFGATSLLLIGLALPLMRRRVRPNRFYGFRTPTTLKDERLWYEVNAKTGLDFMAVGAGLACVTSAHVLGVLTPQVFAVLASAWITGGALWSTVHGFLIIGRRQTRGPADRDHAG